MPKDLPPRESGDAATSARGKRGPKGEPEKDEAGVRGRRRGRTIRSAGGMIHNQLAERRKEEERPQRK